MRTLFIFCVWKVGACLSKKEILKKENVDLVYFEEFNEDYMKLSPEEFVKYLCEKFNGGDADGGITAMEKL